MDYNKIKEAAQNYEADMTRFLRELVHFPGESCGEKDHVMRIKEEMEKLGFDKVDIDPMGNILGYMGSGSTLIGFDRCRSRFRKIFHHQGTAKCSHNHNSLKTDIDYTAVLRKTAAKCYENQYRSKY